MKKLILSAIIALTTARAYGSIDVFMGANFGLSGMKYEDSTIADFLPEAFLGFGLEAGIKYNLSNIYSIGLTGSYDYLHPSSVDDTLVNALGADSARLGFSIIGLSLDNYIRIDQDAGVRNFYLILGAGYARINENIQARANGAPVNLPSGGTDAVMFKVGTLYEVTEHFGLTGTLKLFVPGEVASLGAVYSLGLRATF